MKITDQVWEFAEPLVQACGCSLWDVEYVREGGEWFLRLYLDKEGGVDINDCEQVSRRLDKLIDELAKGRPMEKILRGTKDGGEQC